MNSTLLDNMRKDKIPDIILVRKVYDQSARRQRRNWKLKRLIENCSDGCDSSSVGNEFEVRLFLLKGIRFALSVMKMRTHCLKNDRLCYRTFWKT